jgi:hypothetical protein
MSNTIDTVIANVNKEGIFAIQTSLVPAYISHATLNTIKCLPGCPCEFDTLEIAFELDNNRTLKQEFLLQSFDTPNLYEQLIEATHPCICEGWNIEISEFVGAPVWLTIKKYLDKSNNIYSRLTSIIGKDACTEAMRNEFCVNRKSFFDLNNARGNVFLRRYKKDVPLEYTPM